jgi:hypothetical protein
LPLAIDCNSLAASIGPKTLNAIVNNLAFSDLINCFAKISKSFHASLGSADTKFIMVHRSVAKPNVERLGALNRYLRKLILYRKLSGYKIDLAANFITEITPSFDIWCGPL